MGKLRVGVRRFLLAAFFILIASSLFLTKPDEAFAQQPTPAINPTQGAPGTLIPVLGNAHKATTFLTQMITLAMQNRGEGQEAQLEALKQQIEALPKPKRGDRQAARLQHNKGLEEFKKERYEQALQFFLTAYQLDAGDVEVVNNVGMTYLKTGNLPEAARYLGGALSLAPTRAAAWGNLAEVFARDSRMEEAVAAYALTYRYSKNKDATRRFLEAQTRNVDDPQVTQTAKAALALPLISGGLKEQTAPTLPVPQPVPPPTPPIAKPEPTPTPRPQEAERPQQEAASQQAIQSAASRCTGGQIEKMINAGFSKEEIVRLCETTTESPAKGTLSRESDVGSAPSPSSQRIQQLEQFLKETTGVFDWKVHNELRHLYITNNPPNLRKSMEHSNVILQHSFMDDYILNILSEWQIDKNTSTARANLLRSAESFPDLRFIVAACFLKIGDLYAAEGNTNEARSSYLTVAEDDSSDMTQYRELAEERLRKLEEQTEPTPQVPKTVGLQFLSVVADKPDQGWISYKVAFA